MDRTKMHDVLDKAYNTLENIYRAGYEAGRRDEGTCYKHCIECKYYAVAYIRVPDRFENLRQYCELTDRDIKLDDSCDKFTEK